MIYAKRNVRFPLCFILIICFIYYLCFNISFEANAKNAVKTMKTITESGYAVFTEKNVKTEDMRKKSDLDEKKLIEYMKKYPGLSGIEKNLIELQNRYNVNALLLLAIVRLESGNGRSDIAEKRNNFGGIVGWEKSVRVFVTFDSREDCLNYMADLLSEQYLTSSGRFFNGYSLTAISKKYSASPENWLNLVSNLILEIQSGINET